MAISIIRQHGLNAFGYALAQAIELHRTEDQERQAAWLRVAGRILELGRARTGKGEPLH